MSFGGGFLDSTRLVLKMDHPKAQGHEETLAHRLGGHFGPVGDRRVVTSAGARRAEPRSGRGT